MRARMVNLFIPCISLALMLCVSDTIAKTACKNQVDIVFAVDTTSSLSGSAFENVKAEVKATVKGFTIGKAHIRLALISIANRAFVIANFGDVNSLEDFNAAVDKLTFSSEKASLSEGIQIAKVNVLNKARAKRIPKILILVKDRRSGKSVDSVELSLIASEAVGLKSTGVAIHAVGVGGLWNTLKLQSLFGTEYLLFKNKNALDSIKSLNNPVCEADCPQQGASQTIEGLCYGLTKHVIRAHVALATDSEGISVCRTESIRKFVTCNEKQACNGADRMVSSCRADGKATVTTSWQRFDFKQQSCILLEENSEVNCADTWKCKDQVADVIFLLDKSGSMYPIKNKTRIEPNYFLEVKAATLLLAKSLNIGPDNVKVGILKFGTNVEKIVEFGSINDRDVLLNTISNMKTDINGEQTYTNLGFGNASRIFAKNGRKDVAKYVVLLTDGVSNNPSLTLQESRLLKEAGVTIIAVGIAVKNVTELKSITAPETNTNMVALSDFDKLRSWTDDFTRKMCIRLAAPNIKLCDDKVFYQHVSECNDDKQTVTRTEFKFSDANKCIKTIQTTDYTTCKQVCFNPVDGNMYREDEIWTSLCHEFKCTTNAQQPFVPVRTRCLAADGSCKDIGSPPYRCLNSITKKEVDNCQCIEKDGTAAQAIDNI